MEEELPWLQQLSCRYARFAELKKYEYPVIFDVTHPQEPGGEGKSTSGRRSLALDLAKTATSIGIAGLFFETHPDPDKGNGWTMAFPLQKF
ncbi:MAG: hypothetical protein CM1200mP12_22590 [Gammaproteobacteria bacterium]|nr:MAG: hypothetical protein CM1200mP12_22590 [Gammaproteobacteria bacterium]